MDTKKTSNGVSPYWRKQYGDGKDLSSSTKKKKSSKRRKKNSKYSRSDKWIMAIGGLIIIAILIWPVKRCVEMIEAGPVSGDTIPSNILENSYSYGIDISSHNGKHIAWDSLFVMADPTGKTTKDVMTAKYIFPVDYVFIKATEAVTYVDKNFQDNWSNAGRVNIKRGAYHFYRTKFDPESQAANFINTVGDLRYKDLPPVLDIETIHDGCTKEQLNASCKKWLEIVEKHYGKKPIVYTYESFANNYISDEILEEYPIWIAHYETTYPDRDEWDYWQLSCKAVIHGIRGDVDLSVKER